MVTLIVSNKKFQWHSSMQLNNVFSRMWVSITCLVYLLCSPTSQSFAANYPDYHSLYVNDFANVLTPEEEQSITDQLQAFKRISGVEMAVVTIGSLSDFNHDGHIEPFATGLFNFWGIGDKKRNDGILLLAAIEDRTMRLEVGKGYSVHANRTAQTIVAESILPYFKDAQYAKGIEQGVLEARALLQHRAIRTSKPEPTPYIPPDRNENIAYLFMMIFGVGCIFLFIGPQKIARMIQNHNLKCHICLKKMHSATSEQKTAHLTEAQKQEEADRVCIYDVWHCPKDDIFYAIRSPYPKDSVVEVDNDDALYKPRFRFHKPSSTKPTHTSSTRHSSNTSSCGTKRDRFGGGGSSGGGASGRW